MFVAGNVFHLSIICMKPYAHKNLLESYILFYYRLSWTRRTTKRVFRVLSNQFRIFCSKIYLKSETAKKVVIASFLLHSLLRTPFTTSHTPAGCCYEILEDGAIIEGQWRNEDSLPYIEAFQSTLQLQQNMSGILLGEARHHGNGNTLTWNKTYF